LAEKFTDTCFIYPVHLNPNVAEPVKRILGAIQNIYLLEPVNYYSFVFLMDRAHLIISDSGGVQEEAPSLQTPVLVTRENTERPEVVEIGAVKLVGSNVDTIVSAASDLLQNDDLYRKMIVEHNPYGDGHASERILEITNSYLSSRIEQIVSK
jgi:UDP-N-acetylglucosamine 2-epimerase (non-hydrolysing)